MLNVSNRFLPGVRGTGAVPAATLLLMLATCALAQPRPQGTTQPVVVSPDAFAVGDEIMKLPNASTLFSATMVTFKTQGTTAMAALTELGKKTGFDIRPYDQRTRGSSGTLDLKNAPLCYVLRETCARGTVTPYNTGGGDA